MQVVAEVGAGVVLVVQGNEAAGAIVVVGEAAACGVNPGERAAHAVVGVARGLARAVGVGHKAVGFIPGQALGAALGVKTSTVRPQASWR